MIKGLKLALLASLVTLSGVSAFAIAPTMRQLPDVRIGDQENNIGTDANLFVFPNAFKFDDYVTDADTTLSLLKWSFDEGDQHTSPSVVLGTRQLKINGKTSLHFGSVEIGNLDGTTGTPHLNPSAGSELRVTSSTASFHNIVFSPSPGPQGQTTTYVAGGGNIPGGGYTFTFGTNPPGAGYPTPSTNAYTAGTTTTDAAAGKVVTFYVSDGNALDKKNIIVSTVDNVLDQITGGSPFVIRQDDNFTTDVRSTATGSGWSILGEGKFPTGTGAETDNGYDAINGALTAKSGAYTASPAHFRVTGWQSEKSEWIPWTSIGSNNYVRGKYYLFATGLANSTDLNQMPAVRVRVSARFAQTALLELVSQDTSTDLGNLANRDLRPSQSAAQPSVYRVDLAPVYVPAFNTAGEGAQRAFENYSLDPEDNGTINLTESVIGTYPKSTIPDSQAALKTYTATVNAVAGDLITGRVDDKNSLLVSNVAGEFASLDTTVQSTVTADGTGVTYDTTGVNKDPNGNQTLIRIGIAKSEFGPGSDNTQRVRVEAGKIYKVRYHITSTQASNKQPMIRPRVRTIKFSYTQKFEIGGALNTGSGNQSAGNNLIALQALPGVGTQNPDKISTENGGYYTIILNTPIASDLNPQNPTQPVINALPGPGSATNSDRDLKLAIDLIDSLDTSVQALAGERGNCKLDSIEIRSYAQVPD